MKVKVKLYATLSDYLPAEARKTNEVDLSVRCDATVAEIVEQFRLPKKSVHLVLINGHFVPPAARDGHALREGDVVAIWPPVAGG